MALSRLQREICRRLAAHRIESGESYVAGGAALNAILSTPRLSRDIDVFHDTEEALQSAWEADRRVLETSGYVVHVLRERPSFVEARVGAGDETVLVEWARDSTYRFFPLAEHPDFGLTLHPFDLATNKVLATVGRLEVRDWVDLIQCDAGIQPLGYLVWAACGKDPGWTPEGILEHAARTHYAAEEVASLAWTDGPPDPARLSTRWREMLREAAEIVDLLPPSEVGTCVLSPQGELLRAAGCNLTSILSSGAIRYHRGTIRGAFPRVIPEPDGQ